MIQRTNVQRRSARRLRSQAGTAMIEFALIAPVLILLWMGMVELGRFGTYAILAQGSARSGAGYGAQNLVTAADLVGIQAAATGDAQYLPTPIGVTPNYLCSVNGAMPPKACVFTANPPTNTAYYIQVTVTAQYTPWVAFRGIPSPVNVTGTSYMQVTQQ